MQTLILLLGVLLTTLTSTTGTPHPNPEPLTRTHPHPFTSSSPQPSPIPTYTNPFRHLCNIKCTVSLSPAQLSNTTFLCLPETKLGVQRCVHDLCDCSISPAADAEYNVLCRRSTEGGLGTCVGGSGTGTGLMARETGPWVGVEGRWKGQN
ncbi:hypothetical protein M501DRAFT_985180 [Patellaria atrata CBS 101060]|uniref:Extracellular membrane protein CFEM domain-containing protein n=1 Tax=Patellaria atrata CBS 101060 TaxID=1346257 RepID=A0A9P4SHZ6_9PEZI|nr:hypothetical protein M501DRAFT_985180 [Patellaria atrata CBS 101060]